MSASSRGVPVASPDTTPRSLVLFVRMWAIAHFVHLTISNRGQLDAPWNIVTVAAALVVLLDARRGRWFALMLVGQLVDLLAEMPLSPDHWMLIGFVNLAILVTMARSRSWEIHSIRAAFPAARAILIVAYGAAALSKYNEAFLDPDRSCAAAIGSTASFGLSERLNAGTAEVYSTLLIESSIPILLALPFTRRHGVRLALAFHFFLSASPRFAVVDFSTALFALFLLFLAEDEIGRVWDKLGGWASRSAIVRDAKRVPWVTALLAFVVCGVLGYVLLVLPIALLYLFSEIYLLAILLATVFTWRAGGSIVGFGRLLLVQVPVLLLVLLWAASPYLGLRTSGVFTMFSGIRTEGSDPNHLFMPAWRLTDWQDQLVVIESSNSEQLEDIDPGTVAVPLVMLRQMAMDDPDLEIVGTLDGERTTFGPEEGQMALEPLNFWEERYFWFRPTGVDDHPFCAQG